MKSFLSRFRVSAFTLMLASSLPAAGTQALGKEIESVQFVDRITVGTERMTLNNVAVMRYRLIIKPLVAGLYLADGVQPAHALHDVPKRLEIEYFYALNGKEIGQAADKLLADNVAPDQLVAIRARADRMKALYQDVKPGDRYALTYVPGIGTELALNGQTLGTIEGADFATAYYSIWLGAAPMDVSLKSQLLSR